MGTTAMSGFGGDNNALANVGLSLINGNNNSSANNNNNNPRQNSTFGNAGAQAIMGLNSGAGTHFND
jgi:hypothetical protein